MDRLLNAWKLHASAMDSGLAQPRFAVVESVDPSIHSVRVRIQPEDVLTGWIPDGALAVGNGVGIVCPPSPGDQVFITPAEGDGEHWVVSKRLFDTQSPAPVSPATGKPVQSGDFGVFMGGCVLHMVGGKLFIRAPAGVEIRSGPLLMVCDDVRIEAPGGVEIAEGDLRVSAGDSSDKHGSLDRLRANYDAHDHSGRSVGTTTKPDPE